ncbi:MAG TPA: hypothetical protein VFC07_00260 [Verrucomicrobiae bacterium]|nr:hypothetical protein [Verrucomicrobiae bacterium]
MNKTHICAGALSAAVLASALFLSAGCNKNETSGPGQSVKPAAASAVKNSFQEVTSQLDPGGNLYVYLSTEQWLAGLSDKISGWRELVKSIPDVKSQDQQNIMRVFDVVTSLVKHSGVEDISGVGISSIERETNFYHTKAILHHYKGQGTGYLWSMFGKSAHALNGLELSPASSAIVTFSDFDFPLLWSVLDKEIAQSGIPHAKEELQKVPEAFAKATGLKLDQVLASLGNEYGLVITLNESNKVNLPIPGHAVEVPEPGIMFVIKVNNDLIFNRVDELVKDMQGIIKVDKDGLKMRTFPVPLPLPIALRPTIARSGDYLFVASSDELIGEALAVKAGKKPGLQSTEEFKKLSQGMPQTGNQFGFVSQRFGQTWKDVQTQLVENSPNAQAGQTEFLKKILNASAGSAHSYSVSANGEEGWVSSGNGNQDPGKIVLLPLVVVPATLAAIAVPNFVKAKAKAQSNSCINNLRQIDGAKQMWALENKKAEGDIPTWEDLKPYLHSGIPKCSQGGIYQLNKIGTDPACSIPGHVLNQ